MNVLFNYKTNTVTARIWQNRGSPGIDKQDFKTGLYVDAIEEEQRLEYL